jgi:rhodanese-related sulfurtransferase
LIQQISATQLAQMLQDREPDNPDSTAAPDSPGPCLLDVREPWEIQLVALPGSLCIPMGEIPSRLSEIPASQPVICVCHHGVRSMQVAFFLEQRGIETVYNLQGGIDAWAREVDPSCATY